jgi:hypothetical protein
MSFIGSSKPGYVEKSQQFLGQAGKTFSQQDRIIKRNEPGKTLGGGLMSTASMAASGAMVGSAILPGPGTAIGAVGGAIVGLAGYLFS